MVGKHLPLKGQATAKDLDSKFKGGVGKEYLEIIASSSLHSVAPGCVSGLPDDKTLGFSIRLEYEMVNHQELQCMLNRSKASTTKKMFCVRHLIILLLPKPSEPI